MMCNAKVLRIQRYSESLVPLQAHEEPGTSAAAFHDINPVLESAGAAVMESLVSIKSSLIELDVHLEKRQSHLQGNIWRMNPDARHSVASVEMLALSEDLEAMRLLLLDAGEPSLRQDKAPFVLLHSRIQDLETVLTRLGGALDDHHAQQEALQHDGEDLDPLFGGDLSPLRITLRLLRDCDTAVVLAQWKLCSSMLIELLRDRLPDMFNKIHRAVGDINSVDSTETPHGER